MIRTTSGRSAVRLRLAAHQVMIVGASFVIALPAWCQQFPHKPIRMVTELAAGTGGDINMRRLLPHISHAMGQAVILDNRPGAGGVVAAEVAVRAVPDGYTVLAASQNALVMGRFLSKSNTLDVFRDLVPITQVWKATTLILTGPSLPAKSLLELLKYAKANPGKVSYATSGFGTSHHFSGEEMQQLTGARLVHVPYKGGAGSMQAAMTGEVDVAIGFGATALAVMRTGKVRVLAVIEGKPFGGMHDVPAVAAVIPGFEPPPSWLGVFGPAALPGRLVGRLRSDIVKALEAPGARARAAEEGLELVGNTPEEFTALLRKQILLVGRIAQAANIQRKEH